MNLNYDTYIFDFYGTLLDSYNDEQSAQYWKKWLRILDRKKIKHPDYIAFRREFFELDREYRRRITEQKGYMYPEVDIIDVYRDILQRYGNGVLPEETLYEVAYDFREATREYARLYDGVETYLKALRDNGKKLYLLSNAQRAYTWPEVKMFGIDRLLDDVFISSDYGCMKPETDFYKALFDRYGIDRKTAVMIGDSMNSDIQGAINYGIDYIHLTGTDAADRFFVNELETQK